MTVLESLKTIQKFSGGTDSRSVRRFDEAFCELERVMTPHIERAMRGMWRDPNTREDLRQGMRIALLEAARVLKPRAAPEDEQVKMVCGYLKRSLMNARITKLYMTGSHDDVYIREVGTSKTRYEELSDTHDRADGSADVDLTFRGRVLAVSLHQAIDDATVVYDAYRKSGKRAIDDKRKAKLKEYINLMLQGYSTRECSQMMGVSYESANWYRDDLKHIIGSPLGLEVAQQPLIHREKGE